MKLWEIRWTGAWGCAVGTLTCLAGAVDHEGFSSAFFLICAAWWVWQGVRFARFAVLERD